ncbi:ATP-binding protein [Streptomyces sp. NPDC087850]|uniref:ATP-binding protein n=1 Tax=Streptomyces sp. NPDC087850 TaxID=3365809 RepID=UPI00381988BC
MTWHDTTPRLYARQEFADVSLRTPSAARRFVAEQLDHWHVPGPVSADAEQITGELVANAAEHASGGHVQVALHHQEHVLTVMVTDEGSPTTTPRIGLPDTESESGRGLFLVAVLANNWDWYRRAHGTVVWAELALHHADHQRSEHP